MEEIDQDSHHGKPCYSDIIESINLIHTISLLFPFCINTGFIIEFCSNSYNNHRDYQSNKNLSIDIGTIDTIKAGSAICTLTVAKLASVA